MSQYKPQQGIKIVFKSGSYVFGIDMVVTNQSDFTEVTKNFDSIEEARAYAVKVGYLVPAVDEAEEPTAPDEFKEGFMNLLKIAPDWEMQPLWASDICSRSILQSLVAASLVTTSESEVGTCVSFTTEGESYATKVLGSNLFADAV